MKRKLIVSIALFVSLALIGAWMAGSMLCAPLRQKIGELPPGLQGKTVEFSSASGAILRGWFLPGQTGDGAIILLHGIRGNRLGMLARARFLNQAGYAVLLFDFQSHGESSGDRISFGHLESKDARAAVEFMKTLAPGEKIGVIGISLGGAAVLLAEPKLDVQALVLEEVYPRIDRAITNRLTMRLGGWARILTPLLSLQLKPRLGITGDDLCPIDRIAAIPAPKLLIAAAADRHTTMEESEQLFHAAREPKELWIVAGAKHVDLYGFAKEEYRRRVLLFFQDNLRSFFAVPA
jgi:fermentation-respiration switch protein FrsA (DUF1100 family)